jgi:hypothetical protein
MLARGMFGKGLMLTPTSTRAFILLTVSVFIVWSGALLLVFMGYISRKSCPLKSTGHRHGTSSGQTCSSSSVYRATDNRVLDNTCRYLRELIPHVFRHACTWETVPPQSMWRRTYSSLIFECGRHHKYLSLLTKPLFVQHESSQSSAPQAAPTNSDSFRRKLWMNDVNDNANFAFDCLSAGIRFAVVKSTYVFLICTGFACVTSAHMASAVGADYGNTGFPLFVGFWVLVVISTCIMPVVNWGADWLVQAALTVPVDTCNYTKQMFTSVDNERKDLSDNCGTDVCTTLSRARCLLTVPTYTTAGGPRSAPAESTLHNLDGSGGSFGSYLLSIPSCLLRLYFNAAMYAHSLQANLDSLNLRRQISQLLKHRNSARNNSNVACLHRNTVRSCSNHVNMRSEVEEDSSNDDSGGDNSGDASSEDDNAVSRQSSTDNGHVSSNNKRVPSRPVQAPPLQPVALRPSRFQLSSRSHKSPGRSPALTGGRQAIMPKDKYVKELFIKLRSQIDAQRKQLRSNTDRELFDCCWGIDPAGEFANVVTDQASFARPAFQFLKLLNVFIPYFEKSPPVLESTEKLIKTEILKSLALSESVSALCERVYELNKRVPIPGDAQLTTADSNPENTSLRINSATPPPSASIVNSGAYANISVGRTILDLFLFDILGRESLATNILFQKMVSDRSFTSRLQSSAAVYTLFHPPASMFSAPCSHILTWSVRKDAINYLLLWVICCFNMILLVASAVLLVNCCESWSTVHTGVASTNVSVDVTTPAKVAIYNLILNRTLCVCLFLVAMECFVFETVECAYVHVLGPLFVSEEVGVAVRMVTSTLLKLCEVKSRPTSSHFSQGNSPLRQQGTTRSLSRDGRSLSTDNTDNLPACAGDDVDARSEMNVCGIDEQDCILNSAEYFFVSHQLAQQFSHCFEATIVKAFISHLPPCAYRRKWYFSSAAEELGAPSIAGKGVTEKPDGFSREESKYVKYFKSKRFVWGVPTYRSFLYARNSFCVWLYAYVCAVDYGCRCVLRAFFSRSSARRQRKQQQISLAIDKFMTPNAEIMRTFMQGIYGGTPVTVQFIFLRWASLVFLFTSYHLLAWAYSWVLQPIWYTFCVLLISLKWVISDYSVALCVRMLSVPSWWKSMSWCLLTSDAGAPFGSAVQIMITLSFGSLCFIFVTDFLVLYIASGSGSVVSGKVHMNERHPFARVKATSWMGQLQASSVFDRDLRSDARSNIISAGVTSREVPADSDNEPTHSGTESPTGVNNCSYTTTDVSEESDHH